jgi:hypothetical protein
MRDQFEQSVTLAETVLCRQPEAVKVRTRRRIMGPVLAVMTCLSMVLGSVSPALARDNGNDLAKAVAAAIALGIIVHEIDRNRDQGNRPPRHDPPRPPRVPASCAIEIDGEHRTVTVYPESCLRKAGFDAPLPRNCAKSARVFGRADRIYGVQCLRSAGFRVAGS